VREEIREALVRLPSPQSQILHHHHRAKTFYRIEVAGRSLFLKARIFTSLPRRLGRTLRTTKEEREFSNYLLLRKAGIPCPAPVGAARLYSGPLIKASFLITEFLEEATPLRSLLVGGKAPLDTLLDAVVDLFNLMQEKEIVHNDLQWDNILVQTGTEGPRLSVVDALHVRRATHGETASHHRAHAWFLHFLFHQGASQKTIDGFLDRLPRLGLEGERGRRWILRQAHQLRRRP
jgi:tRNA A-37 threonylcarbamoyl transferase component Bud32